jgi:hypothetical protein
MYCSLPRNRGIWEYTQICITLAKLLDRLFRGIKRNDEYIGKRWAVSSTIGVLVSLPVPPGCPYSEATIGFSLCGTGNQRKRCRNDRIKNLRVLETGPQNCEGWNPGNCVESETFAHLEHFMRRLENRLRALRGRFDINMGVPTPHAPRVFFVSLTCSMSTLQPMAFCRYCVDHAKTLGQHNSTLIVDISKLWGSVGS